MDPIKISAISYLNTIPFVYGIRHYEGISGYTLNFDVPSSCAEKLIHRETDLGIVPVATIPFIPNAEIITDFCIGAGEAVKTVILAAHRPIHETETIYLDPDSRTSALLARVLARYYWNREFRFLPMSTNSMYSLKDNEALVLIGDKTIGLENQFSHVTDLATEWFHFTGLPFVFACWVSNKKLPVGWLHEFNEALKFGTTHITEAIASLEPGLYPGIDIHHYLTELISYPLDEPKRKGMNLFLDYCEKIRKD